MGIIPGIMAPVVCVVDDDDCWKECDWVVVVLVVVAGRGPHLGTIIFLGDMFPSPISFGSLISG